ncbi:hypothetical protein TNIN_310381 [Trichonephila inaurata madagascariensis]|uniref:Uncharacterized protein n=1 Tax=Trichonephila inaurata madagascariensis TaxID=2747483 RepID=A0A8X6YW28_9ARAC|nr:hypothetical protein TNIN_310381 [Trichonephila inaurata madagascariensis]
MISPRRFNGKDFNNEIAREIDYDFIALQHQVTKIILELTPEPSRVFLQVLLRKKPEDNTAGASSGTAPRHYSILKLPLNLAHEDTPICNFSKNSTRGRMF